MRWYGHISRFKAMRMHNKRERKMLLWALSLKPGDVISGCHKWPYNVVVEKAGEVYVRTWRQLELSVRKKRRVDPRGWILDGVEILQQTGIGTNVTAQETALHIHLQFKRYAMRCYPLQRSN